MAITYRPHELSGLASNMAVKQATDLNLGNPVEVQWRIKIGTQGTALIVIWRSTIDGVTREISQMLG